jgi:predicted transcriptional regulator
MNMLRWFKRLGVVLGCAMIAVALVAGSACAAAVGQELPNPQIRDASDNPATIPDFGTHVIAVTYSSTSASDLGDALNDAMKARKYDKSVYRGLGIANLKDSAAPNFVIRKIIKGKMEKYKSTILTDVDLTVPRVWGLGDCKDKSVFILIGKDKKVKYIRYTDKTKPWTKPEIDAVLKLVDELVAHK